MRKERVERREPPGATQGPAEGLLDDVAGNGQESPEATHGQTHP